MAIRGTCFTLGVELALASDIVIAASDSKFGQLEVARGILPFGGGTIRSPKVAGHAKAMQYLLTGETFSAQDALQMGMINEVVAPGEEISRAMEFAQKIAAQAPLAVQATLASSRNSDTENEKKQLFIRLNQLMSTKDVERGMQAFISKQPAQFEGN
jgi:enoyl-CoA hydratase/carnithine racemase